MKQLLALITLLGSTTITFAQGQVFFANSALNATKISTNLLDPPSGYISGPVGTWQFALFSARTDVFSVNSFPWLDPNWEFTGAYATNISLPGRIFGGQNPDGSVAVPGYAAGSYVHLVVVGWDTATGGYDVYSLANAANSGTLMFYGESAIANILLGDGALLVNYFLFGSMPARYRALFWCLNPLR